MKKLFLLLFTTLNALVSAQSPSCNCPEGIYTGRKADTTFRLSNGKTIVFCGNVDSSEGQTTYSEFVLSLCGQKAGIDFWDATTTCSIRVRGNSLLVEELIYLPVGENFSFETVVWITEELSFGGDSLVRKAKINRNIPKYNQEKIKAVLKDYETADMELDDSKEVLMVKLFIATISGSPLARVYLKDSETKFGELDGAYAETYRDLIAMLGLWDNAEY